MCRECGGGGYCEHGKEKNRCPMCNPSGFLAARHRSRIRAALLSQNAAAEESSLDLFGAPLYVVVAYFQLLFVDGMGWANSDDWHIDHRRPCASFDLTQEEERRMCFHYTNLQPMWGVENQRKSDFFDENRFEWIWNGVEWIEK